VGGARVRFLGKYLLKRVPGGGSRVPRTGTGIAEYY